MRNFLRKLWDWVCPIECSKGEPIYAGMLGHFSLVISDRGFSEEVVVFDENNEFAGTFDSYRDAKEHLEKVLGKRVLNVVKR
jgi:hypothetical protein